MYKIETKGEEIQRNSEFTLMSKKYVYHDFLWLSSGPQLLESTLALKNRLTTFYPFKNLSYATKNLEKSEIQGIVLDCF